jgi:hypothetical protein
MIARRKDADLGELLGRFKSFTAKKIESIETNQRESRKDWLMYLFKYFAKFNKQYYKHHFWQYSNHPTSVNSAKIFKQKEDYIHQNPVRAGLVLEPHHWIYSSACADSPLKYLFGKI